MLPETFQTPHLRHLALGLSPSNKISITHDHREPRHTRSFCGYPICLFSAKYSTPMAFIHAPTGDARDRLFIPCSQP
jgi:hypothetical protein